MQNMIFVSINVRNKLNLSTNIDPIYVDSFIRTHFENILSKSQNFEWTKITFFSFDLSDNRKIIIQFEDFITWKNVKYLLLPLLNHIFATRIAEIQTINHW